MCGSDVPVGCPGQLSGSDVRVKYQGQMSWSDVLVSCQGEMSRSNVLVRCPRHMAGSHVLVRCQGLKTGLAGWPAGTHWLDKCIGLISTYTVLYTKLYLDLNKRSLGHTHLSPRQVTSKIQLYVHLTFKEADR